MVTARPDTTSPTPDLHPNPEAPGVKTPCPSSLWNVVVVQFQNAFLDKIVQYLLAGLAFVLPTLTKTQADIYPRLGALLLALPSILMSPLAGWLSDRYSKRDVLFWCAVVQLGMLIFTAVALQMDWFWVSTVVFFFLGMQATMLIPAKGGIVKELVGEKHLTFANSWVNGSGLIAITLGPWIGGLLVKWYYPDNRLQPNLALVVPVVWLCVAAATAVFCAWRLPRTPVTGKTEKFRPALLVEHFGNLASLLSQRHLRLPALGVSFFWFSATMLALMLFQTAEVLMPGVKESHAQVAGLLLVGVGVGIALGSVLVSVVSVERIELGLIPLGGLGMAVFCVLASLPIVDYHNWIFKALLMGIGLSSGVFLVPLNAYLQDLVDPETRGRQLGAASLLDSIAMLIAIIAQAVFTLILPGETGVRIQFFLTGVLCLLAAIYVVRMVPQNFFRFVLLSLVKIIYRVKVNHGTRIPRQGGALLLSNHVSYIDAFVISAASDRKVRFIANDTFHRMAIVGWFLKMFNVVPVSPTRAKDAIVTLADTLKRGHVVCMFPEGQLTRTGFVNEIRKGFELIARKSGCPVVPVYMDDLWGSVFSFERGKFLDKWPRHFAYRVTVLVGDPIPAEEATAERVRETIRNLSAEALRARGELRPRIEEAVVRSLARHPWKLGWIGREPMSRGNLLAYAQLLALRWTHLFQSHRVGVIASGKNAVLANLALRLAGFAPVNINVVDTESLEAALVEHSITTILLDDLEGAPQCEQVINLQEEIANIDNFRLGMAIVATYLLPTFLHARIVRKRRRYELSSHEAVGWLRTNAEGQARYHSMTHHELLAQSEQLHSVDSCREGETVCSPHGYANVEGTVLGFWNALLTGATLCASVRQAKVVVTDRPAWEALSEHGVDASNARAIFLCGDQTDIRDIQPTATNPLLPCLVPRAMDRFVAMSLPHPTIPTKTADHQDGWKPQALGRLLPGFKAEKTATSLLITGPDDSCTELPNVRLDLEDFLMVGNI